MRKKNMVLLIVALLVLSIGVGVTVAFLVSSSHPVVNTFTVGEVKITLAETTGPEYKLSPGVSHLKDPAVTVKAESEGCWLYVKLNKSADFDAYCAFEIESGWTMLPSDNTVFFRQVENTEADQVFRVLKDDRVTVHETLTEEILNAMTVFPTLTFTAFAIQSEGVSTPQDGWQILNS